MNETPKITLAMCWKCGNRIEQPMPAKTKGVRGFEIVGCRENPVIKNFDDAQRLCSIIVNHLAETKP